MNSGQNLHFSKRSQVQKDAESRGSLLVGQSSSTGSNSAKILKGRQRRSKGRNETQSSRSSTVLSNKQNDKASNDRQITDYFQVVRRSNRRNKQQIQEDSRDTLAQHVQDYADRESRCFKIVTYADKGRGVLAATSFQRGEFVVEYAGELIEEAEAQRREKSYEEDSSIGCYMYYFVSNSRKLCVDATRETSRVGRLINHSRRDANLITRCVVLNDLPRLLFFAKRDLRVDEELLYDYGDRSRSVIETHPWLKT